MFIVKFPNGEYQYHRRKTNRMYENRMARGKDIEQARVFTTLSGAKNSDGMQHYKGEAVEVKLVDVGSAPLKEKLDKIEAWLKVAPTQLHSEALQVTDNVGRIIGYEEDEVHTWDVDAMLSEWSELRRQLEDE